MIKHIKNLFVVIHPKPELLRTVGIEEQTNKNKDGDKKNKKTTTTTKKKKNPERNNRQDDESEELGDGRPR